MVTLVSHNKFKGRRLLILIWKFKEVMAKISAIFLIFQSSKVPVIMCTFQEQERKGQKEDKIKSTSRLQKYPRNFIGFLFIFH